MLSSRDAKSVELWSQAQLPRNYGGSGDLQAYADQWSLREIKKPPEAADWVAFSPATRRRNLPSRLRNQCQQLNHLSTLTTGPPSRAPFWPFLMV